MPGPPGLRAACWSSRGARRPRGQKPALDRGAAKACWILSTIRTRSIKPPAARRRVLDFAPLGRGGIHEVAEPCRAGTSGAAGRAGVARTMVCAGDKRTPDSGRAEVCSIAPDMRGESNEPRAVRPPVARLHRRPDRARGRRRAAPTAKRAARPVRWPTGTPTRPACGAPDETRSASGSAAAAPRDGWDDRSRTVRCQIRRKVGSDGNSNFRSLRLRVLRAYLACVLVLPRPALKLK